MPRTARRLSVGSAGTPGFSSALIEVARHVWREPRRDTTEVTAGDCVSICICQSFDTGSGRVSLSAWPGRPSRNTARTHVTALCQRLGVNLQRPKQILQGPRRCRSSCTTWQLHFRGTVGRCGKGGAPESATALLAHKGAPISATQPRRNGTRAASTSVCVGPANGRRHVTFRRGRRGRSRTLLCPLQRTFRQLRAVHSHMSIARTAFSRAVPLHRAGSSGRLGRHLIPGSRWRAETGHQNLECPRN